MSPAPQPAKSKPAKSPKALLPRIAIVTSLAVAAASFGASTAVFEKAFAQQPPALAGALAGQPYQLRCWQDAVQILNVREPQALQSFSEPSARALTLENADGSRRVLAPLGDSLCVLEFTAAKN